MLKTILIFMILGFCAVLIMPIGIIAFVLSFVGLKGAMSVFTYKIAQGWALMTLKISGCPISIEGRENIPKKGGVCFVSNHEGIFDIILALASIGRPFGFIAKKDLLLLPFLNAWIYILGGLFIDRKNPRKALKTINKGIRRLKAGGAMLIFPEGHRSKGQGLLPFKSGSFKLATQSGVPIVPVSVSGSYEIFEKNKRLNPVIQRMVFSPPLATDGISLENRKSLADEVKGIIEAAL